MKRIALTLLAIVLVASPVISQIINVPADQPSIQAGIDSASNGDTVLVAEETYFENINFKGKAITVASRFILDGDTSHISKTVIDGSQPTHPDTASVVLMISGEDSTSVLNGFTITGGKGTRILFLGSTFYKAGGGVIAEGGKIINNLVISNSLSAVGIQVSGGGIFGVDLQGVKSVVVRNNRVSGNVITSNTYAQGGGIFTGSEAGLTLIEGNEVRGNKSICTGTWKANAGGIMLGSAKPWEACLIVRDNLIIENEIHCVASQGGGIFLTFPLLGSGYQSGKAGIEIYNNIIANNFSEDRGGGIAIWDQLNGAYEVDHPIPLIYNNTIVGNTAKEGAGLYNFEMNALLFNNIIWNDKANGAEEISLKDTNYSGHLTNHGKFQSWFNNIQGGYDGIGNINQDPLLDSETFKLAENSPCVGRGVDSLEIDGSLFVAPPIDFYGNSRPNPIDDRVDIGAMESPFEGFVFIPDTAFFNALIEEGVDTNGDSLISYAEAEAVDGFGVQESGISDMTGIEAFTNLEFMDCSNNQLTSLDVSKNIRLGGDSFHDGLICSHNQLTHLDVSNCIDLHVLDCSHNQLTNLDLSDNINLSGAYDWNLGLNVSYNQLSEIDISNCHKLSAFYAYNMPSLNMVCVWDGIFSDTTRILIDTTESPNVYFTTECTVGFEENKISGFTIYPNPTNASLTIETEYPNHYAINITTLNGQMVFTGEMEGTSHQIDLSSFQKGVYFITIRSKDFVTTRKIIKL